MDQTAEGENKVVAKEYVVERDGLRALKFRGSIVGSWEDADERWTLFRTVGDKFVLERLFGGDDSHCSDSAAWSGVDLQALLDRAATDVEWEDRDDGEIRLPQALLDLAASQGISIVEDIE